MKIAIVNRKTGEKIKERSSYDPFDDNFCVGLDGKVYRVGDSYGDGAFSYCVDDEYYALINMDGK